VYRHFYISISNSGFPYYQHWLPLLMLLWSTIIGFNVFLELLHSKEALSGCCFQNSGTLRNGKAPSGGYSKTLRISTSRVIIYSSHSALVTKKQVGGLDLFRGPDGSSSRAVGWGPWFRSTKSRRTLNIQQLTLNCMAQEVSILEQCRPVTRGGSTA
jgi:hypothetical protein